MAAGTFVITINFPDDANIAKIRDDFCIHHGYQATVPDPQNPSGPQIPNPVSKVQFIKAKVIDFLREGARAGRVASAVETTRQTKSAEIDAMAMN